MWTCRYCGERHKDQFEACWNCETPAGGNSPPAAPEADTASGPVAAAAEALPAKRSTAGMTEMDLAMLACRRVALVLFAQAAYFLLTGGLALVARLTAKAFGGSGGQDDLLPLVLVNLPSVALAAVGLYYWNYADLIARRMIGDGAEKIAAVAVRVPELTTVAFSLAGVFLFVEAAREAVGLVYLVSEHSRWFREGVAAELLRLPQFWTTAVQFAASLWLILGSRGIVRGIRWLRQAGIQSAEVEVKVEGRL